MSFWTTSKTVLALVSIGILMTPVLRRLGYLPPENSEAPAGDEAAGGNQTGAADAAPPELNLPHNGSGGESAPRH
ncbi:MAG: hypothetical protein JWQ90_3313 [Hydrocarboniphaga sp.]|uniref:hypothetical protein n=1 Tax=Hydrocarboniphaga sp. TaxID=2033016 RepID=UPI00261D3CC4|nr:hypothetical protein [Hydrocarboniphaga sp.]MDB5970863.1 hypothetical protein [Hydrocarboniphaga sp.]